MTEHDDGPTDLPRFQPMPEATPDPLDPEATTVTSSPWESEEPDDSWGDDEPTGPTTSPPSTGPSPASTRADWRDFRELLHTIVALVSVGVRFSRTRRRQLPEHIWVADEADQEAIGDPLARIAARHTPITGGDAGDVVDGLLATVGVAGYAVKNLNAERPYTPPGVPDLTEPPVDAA